VRIADLHLHRLDIPFREAFRHSAAERAATETLWVTARTAAGFHGNGEGCPRRYVTGEDSTSALAFFREHRASLVSEVDGLASLTGWIASHRDAIDRNPATFCAVELAILDALAREGGASVEELLGHRPLPRALRVLRGPRGFVSDLVRRDARPLRAARLRRLQAQDEWRPAAGSGPGRSGSGSRPSGTDPDRCQ
jgi:L-alanine-DL-glutamate epimerase-like enolase superfamily enzyme